MKATALLIVCWFYGQTGAEFCRNRPPLHCCQESSQALDVCLNPDFDGHKSIFMTDQDLLGHGLSGFVQLFNASTQVFPLAVKTTLVDDTEETLHEFDIATRLNDHRNIVATYDLYTDGEYWYQVMEFVPFRLQDLVTGEALDQDQIECAFTQIIDGVSHMHDLGIAHLDLKMSNILVSKEGVVKLIDFGSSVIHRTSEGNQTLEGNVTGERGALSYLAPEVLGERPYNPAAADVWALGITYVCMLLGRCPWLQARYFDESFALFTNDSSSLIERLPGKARNLIARMLNVSPQERIGIGEIRNMVSSWIQDVDCRVVEEWDAGGYQHRRKELRFGYNTLT